MDPKTDLNIVQNIDFGSTAAAFSEGQADYTVEFEPGATSLETGHERICGRFSRNRQRIHSLYRFQCPQKLYQ
mgnify:CR=1 FL=1